jgi:hypothetical protein
MTQYAFHPDARDELDEIWDYRGRSILPRRYARRLLIRIEGQIGAIRLTPQH